MVENCARCLVAAASAVHEEALHCMIDTTYHHLWVTTAEEDSSNLNCNLQCACGAYRSKNQKFISLNLMNAHSFEASDGIICEEVLVCQVLDPYVPTVNALKTAFTAANMVLGIYQYIFDTR